MDNPAELKLYEAADDYSAFRTPNEAVAEQTGDEEFARLEQIAEREPHGPFSIRSSPPKGEAPQPKTKET